MEQKYELLREVENIIIENGVKLYQIRALKDFSNVKAGQIGGYVQSTNNLSQNGNCWVDPCAKVYGNASVDGNAFIGGKSSVFGYAKVNGNAQVIGNVSVYGYATITGEAQICGYIDIADKTHIGLNAVIENNGEYITVSGYESTVITFFVTDSGIGVYFMGCYHAIEQYEEYIEKMYKSKPRKYQEFKMLIDTIKFKLGDIKPYRRKIYS